MNLCPIDHRPVEIVIDTAAINKHYPKQSWYQPDIKSLWRFGPVLGLNLLDQEDAKSIVSLGEGYTPEVPLEYFTQLNELGVQLLLKDEGQPHPGYGSNPTGSFKDRGMTMAVSMAKSFGLDKLVVPTQGNAGDSLVEYATKAGMQTVVIMPEDTPMPIMGRVAALAHQSESIQLRLVKGTIREAGELMKAEYVPKGYFNMATFQEPGWRIEGKKTLGYELAEPRGAKLNWELPDVVIYPTGGGTGILGMWKAFDELEQLGVIDQRRPKIISVQSNQTPPLVNAFQQQAKDTQAVNAGNTIATGLNVPGGVGHFKVLDIIGKSGGAVIGVDELNIARELKNAYDQTGIWISPEGAACLAAITPALNDGLIEPNNKVVVFNTGSFEKYLGPSIRKIIFGKSVN